MKNTIRILMALMATIFLQTVGAQPDYPSKPIKLILGFAPGGISDVLVRQIAEFADDTRSAQIIIEYRPGASSTIATGMVKRAAPDGYTVHLMSPSAMQVMPNIQSLSYDPLKDFSYIGMVLAQPQPLYVLTSSPFHTFSDVIDYARANPGKFSWATAGTNSLAQILLQNAFKEENVETTVVGYKGGSEAINSLLGGHVQAVASTDFGPLLADGRARLIVETGEEKAIPDVKTLKELGYSLSSTLQYGIVGPANMDQGAIAWWDNLLNDFSQSPRAQAFAKQYYGVLAYASPAETASEVERGYKNIGRTIRELRLNSK